MRHLEAYAAGGDAHERGEPAQPPATIPRDRKEAWLKGWTDQQAFMERQAAGRKQKPPPSAAPRKKQAVPLAGPAVITSRARPNIARWCTDKTMHWVYRHVACYTTRTVTGIPRHVIRLTTLHAIFASVR